MKFNHRNVHVSPSAVIGTNVKIGDNACIYDNVVIGDNTIICNDCHIGEPLGDYYRNDEYTNPSTIIGKDCLIRSHSIIYATNVIGDSVSTGHFIKLRTGNKIGNHCSIGNSTELHGDAVLGNYVRLHSDVCICEHAVIGSFVWIFPGTILSNGVNPPGNTLLGPSVGDYSVLAVNVVVLPGVAIGEHCLIGAASVVTRDADSYSVVVGNPARRIKDVRDVVSKQTGKKYYPWPYQFERSMPWQGIGYEQWKTSQKS